MIPIFSIFLSVMNFCNDTAKFVIKKTQNNYNLKRIKRKLRFSKLDELEGDDEEAESDGGEEPEAQT